MSTRFAISLRCTLAFSQSSLFFTTRPVENYHHIRILNETEGIINVSPDCVLPGWEHGGGEEMRRRETDRSFWRCWKSAVAARLHLSVSQSASTLPRQATCIDLSQPCPSTAPDIWI